MKFSTFFSSAIFLSSSFALDPNIDFYSLFTTNDYYKPHINRPRDIKGAVSISHTNYIVTIEIGTPPQSVNVSLDTTSSDLWVVSTENIFCAQSPLGLSNGLLDCRKEDLAFNQNASTTFHDNSTLFETLSLYLFAPGEGFWGTDTVGLGGAIIESCSLAVALNTTSTGVLGLGFPYMESTMSAYENVPQLLRAENFINHVAYSMWVQDPLAVDPTGEVLFGAIDHAKYEEPLYTMPMVRTITNTVAPSELAIVINGFSISDSMGNISTIMNDPAVVGFNVRGALTLVPDNVFELIQQALGAQPVPTLSTYVVYCSVQTGDVNLIFDFSGAIISLPLSYFLAPTIQYDPFNGLQFCQLLLYPIGNNHTFYLGKSFVNGAYVVFDLDNYEISLAKAKPNVTASDIETIVSTVPSAVRAASYSSTGTVTSVKAHNFTGVFSTGNPSSELCASGGRALPGPVVPRYARNC